jgi:phage/plasmid-associated DNA primase
MEDPQLYKSKIIINSSDSGETASTKSKSPENSVSSDELSIESIEPKKTTSKLDPNALGKYVIPKWIENKEAEEIYQYALKYYLGTENFPGLKIIPLSGKEAVTKGWQNLTRKEGMNAFMEILNTKPEKKGFGRYTKTIERNGRDITFYCRSVKDKETDKWVRKGQPLNIGLCTGFVNDFFVLDIDNKNGGVERFQQLLSEHSNFPDTWVVETGGGGFHCYFKYDPDFHTCSNVGGNIGWDIRSDGGYIAAPGSIHPTTLEPYTWAEGYEPWKVKLIPVPLWLKDILLTDKWRTPKKYREKEENQKIILDSNLLFRIVDAMKPPESYDMWYKPIIVFARYAEDKEAAFEAALAYSKKNPKNYRGKESDEAIMKIIETYDPDRPNKIGLGSLIFWLKQTGGNKELINDLNRLRFPASPSRIKLDHTNFPFSFVVPIDVIDTLIEIFPEVLDYKFIPILTQMTRKDKEVRELIHKYRRGNKTGYDGSEVNKLWKTYKPINGFGTNLLMFELNKIDKTDRMKKLKEECPLLSDIDYWIYYLLMDCGIAGNARIYTLLMTDNFVLRSHSTAYCYDFETKLWKLLNSEKVIAHEVITIMRTVVENITTKARKYAQEQLESLMPDYEDMSKKQQMAEKRELSQEDKEKLKRCLYLNGKLLQKVNAQCKDPKYIKNVTTALVSESILDNKTELDKITNGIGHVLAHSDKVLDFKEKKNMNRKREHYCKEIIPIEYDETANDANVMKWIHDTNLNDVTRERDFQKISGLLITGDNPGKNTILLIGASGNNSKTVYTLMMKGILGNLAAALPAKFLVKNKGGDNPTGADPFLMMAEGKTVLFFPEMPEGAELREDILKLIRGGDLITARQLFGIAQTFRLSGKPVLISNPDILLRDPALMRGTLNPEFPVQFVDHEEGKELKPNQMWAVPWFRDVMPFDTRCLQTWLNYCVKGAQMIYDDLRGPTKMPVWSHYIRENRAEKIKMADPVTAFFNDRTYVIINKSSENGVKARQLYARFEKYCKDKSIANKPNDRDFYLRLGIGEAPVRKEEKEKGLTEFGKQFLTGRLRKPNAVFYYGIDLTVADGDTLERKATYDG